MIDVQNRTNLLRLVRITSCRGHSQTWNTSKPRAGLAIGKPSTILPMVGALTRQQMLVSRAAKRTDNAWKSALVQLHAMMKTRKTGLAAHATRVQGGWDHRLLLGLLFPAMVRALVELAGAKARSRLVHSGILQPVVPTYRRGHRMANSQYVALHIGV